MVVVTPTFSTQKKEQYGFDCDDPNYHVVKVTIVENDLKKRSPIELNIGNPYKFRMR